MYGKVVLWGGREQKEPSQTKVGTLDFPDNFKSPNARRRLL